MNPLQQNIMQLEALDKEREAKRQRMDDLLEQKKKVESEIQQLEVELEQLDDRMERLEEACLPGSAAAVVPPPPPPSSITVKPEPHSTTNSSSHHGRSPNDGNNNHELFQFQSTSASEQLTDPMTQTQTRPSRVSLDTQLTEPSSQSQLDLSPVPLQHTSTSTFHHRSGPSAIRGGQLEIQRVAPAKKKKPPPNNSNNDAPSADAGTGTLDAYFGVRQNSSPYFNNNSNNRSAGIPPPPPSPPPTSTAAGGGRPPSRASLNSNSNHQSTSHHSHASTSRFNRSDYPWAQKVQTLLQQTFRIQQFREHQREVINCTLSGEDVFVLMRTGGGKSLTYQLPALLEGRHSRSKKVTLVISPLLSLIKDQEDQMNAFSSGSAVSFTSNLPGGNEEHKRRWDLVRNPNQGICLILVTPEKVYKSNKLKSELQKLNDQGRLGRFVVDEAHCCSNWGHDFRPDYTKLGLLREHFPHVPIMAVTATASDRVRHDVCDILLVNRRCPFFRSSSNRPNLTYMIKSKPTTGGGNAVLDDMAAFIKAKYPQGAGIVYTFSRKDADTVADKLCDRGIVAESYHSDVSKSKKDSIHKSWMRNETQVVVATIAFGLGINKPDVRFVLHHSLSKNLEAYYQESGRAGRDGKPSHCVLYYSPKDVTRMIKMVHGESVGATQSLWSMVRYAQESGGDLVCRSIILATLGEASMNTDAAREQEMQSGTVTYERRDVGKHAQTVTRLLQAKLNQGERITMDMLVREWRAKPDLAESCVADNPPGKDLSPEECERIIIMLMENNIFNPDIRHTAYQAVVYLDLGRMGNQMLSSPNPRVDMNFPKKEKKVRGKKSTGDGVDDHVDEESMNAKPAAKKKPAKKSNTNKSMETKKKTAAKKTTISSRKRKQSTTTNGKVKATKKKKSAAASNPMASQEEVIVLSSSDDDDEPVGKRTARPRSARNKAAPIIDDEENPFWDSDSDECEFE